jgi:hypothetical protein
VHADPDAELAQAASEIEEPRLVLLTAPLGGAVADIDAIRRRILRDHQNLADARAS